MSRLVGAAAWVTPPWVAGGERTPSLANSDGSKDLVNKIQPTHSSP
jgi:hypothetical protein